MDPDILILKSAERKIKDKMRLKQLPNPMASSKVYHRTASLEYPRQIRYHEYPKDYKALIKAEAAFRHPFFQAAGAAWGRMGNLIMSPVTMLFNLGSVYMNCNGETEDQLARVLRWTRGKEAFRRGAEDLMSALVIPRCRAGYKMSLTSLVFRRWEEGEEHDPYVGVADLFQTAPIPSLLTCPFLSRCHMNSIVDRNTKGRLSNLVPEGWLGEKMQLVGVSGLYLRGFSQPGFWRYATAFREFWTDPDTCLRVPMLHTQGDFLTYHDPDLRASFLVLHYPEGMFLVVVVPKEADGLPNLEPALTPKLVRRSLGLTKAHHTLVAVPKMILDQTRDYTEVLEHIGLRTLCDPASSQFSGEKEWMWLDHLIQRAAMPLDEQSSKSETEDVEEVMKDPDVCFLVDRPFHWQVIHFHTTVMLLQGRVTDPTAVTCRQQ